MASLSFEYSYANLPSIFYENLGPTKFPKPTLLKWNHKLGQSLGIDAEKIGLDRLAEIFSGADLQPGAKPIAQAYSGHQFGHFNFNLGDGRAMLLGELRSPSGKLFDVHLKGSGPTQFSRRGDGLANLAAVVREYLVSEGMFSLGIPTSRTLAIIGTGENVYRETPQPGAILVRVASSHIRVGTFERFASQNELGAVKTLLQFSIRRHHPDLGDSDVKVFFERTVEAQAKLVAQWQSVGFIHGVMNTDNTFISGETLDYGPCAFLEEYNPDAVFSSIDSHGRYAFQNQAGIMKWNLQCLLNCLAPAFQSEHPKLVDILNQFDNIYETHLLNLLGLKLGFKNAKRSDAALFSELFGLLFKDSADYTNGFVNLLTWLGDKSKAPVEYQGWISKWISRLGNQGTEETKTLMSQSNPVFIPRNHLVEAAIREAISQKSFAKFDRLLKAISSPFTFNPELQDLSMPAEPGEKVTETFCNT